MKRNPSSKRGGVASWVPAIRNRLASRRRHSTAGQLAVIEALESRTMLTGTAASPFDAPVFSSLPDTPQLVTTVFAFSAGQGEAGLRTDLDGNGKADLIVQYDNGADPKTDFLSTMLGQASGAMTEHLITSYGSGNELVDVTAADLNNDTRMDLVVHWEHPGTGEGEFIDTDGDSIPDTFVTGDEHHLDIFLGNADGSFTKNPTTLDIDENASVNVFKMNADANADIVLNISSTKLDVLLGNGNGTFQAPVRTNFGVGKLISEFDTDLSGDGITDVILNYSDFLSPKALEVYLGQASGSYQSTPSFSDTTHGYTLMGLHKFSGDSRPDMLVSIAPTDPLNPFPPATNVAVLLNNGSASFTETFNKTLTNGLRGSSGLGVAAGDLNGDGVEDMVIFDGSSTATLSPVIVRVEINGGNGTFTEPQSFSVDRFSNAYIQDIDNDSRPELIVNRRDQDTTPAGASVFFNGGTGTFITPDVFVTSTSETLTTTFATFQDMGADHRAEAIMRKISGGFTAPITENKLFGFKQNANRTFGVEHLTDLGANTVSDFALLDYTGDDNADVLVYQNFTAGSLENFFGTADSLKVYRGVGDGSLTAPAGVLAFGGSVQPVSYPVDYEGDGDFDLFVVGSSPSGIYVVLNTGNNNGGGGPVDNAGNTTGAARDIGTPGAQQNFPDFVGTGDTQDFYRITVTPASRVHVALAGLTSNADLQLLDSTGSVITSSASLGTTDESITRNLTAGTYYIRVFQTSGDTNYSLAVSSVPLAVVIGVQLGNIFITSGQTSIDFGTVSQGGDANTMTFTVQNNGNDTLTLQTPTLPAGYSLGSDALVATLDPTATDTFTVQLDSAVEGSKPGNISIGNNSTTNPFLIPVTGSVVNIPLPHIAVAGNANAITDGDAIADIPDGTDFGSVVQGTTPIVRTFTVTNTGTAALTLGTPSLPAHFTIIDPLVASLDAGLSDTFSIQFDTATLGAFSGEVSIVTNDSARNPFNFAISGVVTTEPQAIIAILIGIIPVAGSINFGDVSQGTPPPSRTFTVRNDGTAPLNLQTPVLPQGFVFGSDTLDSVLQPSGFDTFTVILDTSTVGAPSGDIQIISNDAAHSPFNIPILGVVTTAPNQTFTLTPTNKLAKFKDANGSDIAVTFAGKTGSVVITRTAPPGEDGDIATIALNGTDDKAKLTITGKGGSDIGATTVGAVTGNGSLAALTGKLVDLTGAGVDLDPGSAIAAWVLRDILNGADIDAPGVALVKGVKATFGKVGNGSDMSFGSPIAALTLNAYGTGGTITTPWLGKLIAKPDAKRSIPTDFAAGMNLSGVNAPKDITLGGATFTGRISGGHWEIADGSVGAISATTFADGWSVNVPDGSIKSLVSNGNASVDVTALSLAALTVKGNLIESQVTVNQVFNPLLPKLLTLGKISVVGTAFGSVFRSSGNAGAATFGSLVDSKFLVGVQLAVVDVPDAADDFAADATLASLAIKGIKTAPDDFFFANSIIAASNIGSIALVDADLDNGGTSFGVAFKTFKAIKLTQAGDNFAWSTPWLTSPVDLVINDV